MKVKETIDLIVSDEDLSIKEKIRQLKAISNTTNALIDEEIAKLKNSIHYCPLCGRCYTNDQWKKEKYESWSKEVITNKPWIKNTPFWEKVIVNKEICPIGHVFEEREYLGETFQ